MKRPWMPLHIPDFISDTTHLSAAETGAYLMLILHYWMQDGLPGDDAKLAVIARVPLKTWRQMRPTLQAFFRDGWRHKRIDIEIQKMITTSERRRSAGSVGGTRSSINRTRGKQLLDRDSSKPSSRATANEQQTVQQTGQQKSSPAVAPYTSKTINTSSVAPRASETANKSTTEQAEDPAGFAEKARDAVQKTTGIASGELASTLQAKGWVR